LRRRNVTLFGCLGGYFGGDAFQDALQAGTGGRVQLLGRAAECFATEQAGGGGVEVGVLLFHSRNLSFVMVRLDGMDTKLRTRTVRRCPFPVKPSHDE